MVNYNEEVCICWKMITCLLSTDNFCLFKVVLHCKNCSWYLHARVFKLWESQCEVVTVLINKEKSWMCRLIVICVGCRPKTIACGLMPCMPFPYQAVSIFWIYVPSRQLRIKNCIVLHLLYKRHLAYDWHWNLLVFFLLGWMVSVVTV